MASRFFISLDYIDDFLGNDAAGEVSLTASVEGDFTRSDGEERVVAADAHILTSLDLGTALADDDHTRAGGRAVAKLHPKILWVRIGKVFCGSACFS